MRILHVVECEGGGVLSLLRAFCEAQSRAGHDVDLLAPADRVAHANWYPWAIDRGRPASLASAASELSATVRETRPDVVHLHSFFAGALGRIALNGTHAPPVVYQPHSWAFEAVTGATARHVVTAVERLLDRRSDQLLVNCADELAEGRRNHVTTPGQAVGIPIDTDVFCPVDPAARAQLRSELGCRQHTVLCVGRIARQKGQDRLVAAWREHPIPATELVLAGAGNVDELRHLAGDEWGRSIRWVGDQSDIRPWLRAADVLVLPSRYEGQSVAVSEALACGLPVVMCAVNGAEAAVVEGPEPCAGVVVDQGDMDSLLTECRRRVVDDALRERESQAARLRATALFAEAVVHAGVEAAYRRGIAARDQTVVERSRPRSRVWRRGPLETRTVRT